MNGTNHFAYFEDRIHLTGFRVCDNKESAIRSNAASLMHKSENAKPKEGARLKLICLQESLVFTPPLYINDIYHRQSIAHKDIMGFFLAPSYNDRMILVVQDGSNQFIHLYAIQLSSTQKAQEICALLGETKMNGKPKGQSENSVKNSVTVKQSTSKTLRITAADNKSSNTHSDEKNDYATEKSPNVSDSPKSIESRTDSATFALQNGRTDNSRGSSSLSSRNSGKIPGIISSDIEHDWDNNRSISRAQWMEDLDECISIGYYDDDRDVQDKVPVTSIKDGEKSKAQNLGSQNAWMENITYISNDPVRGSYVTSNGSIYMYVAQQVNPRYANNL